MALTQVNSDGIKDGEVKTADIADQAVDLTKLPHGDTNSDAKFLRSNNGADPTWEAVTSVDAAAVNSAGAVMNTDLDGKGELLVGDGSGDPTALAVGTNDYVLTADSSEATGVKWAAASSGAALTGSTDNTVVTVTGANAMQGEANLTFDGTTLGVNNATPKITLTDSDTTGPPVCLLDGSGGDLDLESDINNAKNDSKVRVFIDGSEKVRFQTGGGMSFNGDTAAANALDDYEEGDWTPTSPASTVSSNSGKYTKIGRHVLFEGSLTFGSESGNNRALIEGLPFAASGSYGGGYIRYTNVNPGEEWFSLDIPGGDDHIEMNESSPDSIKRNDVSTKRLDFCGQYIA